MSVLHNFLRALPAFDRFSDRQLDIAVGQMMQQDYPAGHILIRQNQPGAAMFLVLAGTVAVTRCDALTGAELETREAHAGEVVGLLSLADAIPSQESCLARTPVQVALLTREALQALMLLAPAVAHQFEFMLAVQLARELQHGSAALQAGLGQQRAVRPWLERLLGRRSSAL
jgi:CRP-like cAMP-binding protein